MTDNLPSLSSTTHTDEIGQKPGLSEKSLIIALISEIRDTISAIKQLLESSPTPPRIYINNTKRSLEKTKKEEITETKNILSRGVKGGAFEGDALEVAEAWNFRRKSIFGLPKDRTTSAAMRWIAQRLQEHSVGDLVLCVNRYFKECEAAGKEGRYLYALRNFFGSFSYYEAYLGADWTMEPASGGKSEPKMYIVPDRQEGDVF